MSTLPGDLPIALCDPKQMTQVLTNLLSNATKYTQHAGGIKIVARIFDDKEQTERLDGIPILWGEHQQGT